MEALTSTLQCIGIATLLAGLLIIGSSAQHWANRQYSRRLVRQLTETDGGECRECGADSGGLSHCGDCYSDFGAGE